jgi:hypothetical protein
MTDKAEKSIKFAKRFSAPLEVKIIKSSDNIIKDLWRKK